MDSNMVYQASLFKEVKLFDVCNLSLSVVNGISSDHCYQEWTRQQNDLRPSTAITFQDWYELFDFLHIGLDERIEMLSQLGNVRPVAKRLATADKSCKLAVKRYHAAEMSTISRCDWNSQSLPQFLAQVDRDGTPYLVQGIEYASFDVVVFEFVQVTDQCWALPRLEQAQQAYERLCKNPREQGIAMPEGVKLAYFDNVSKNFASGLSLNEIMGRRRALVSKQQLSIVGVYLTHLNDYFGLHDHEWKVKEPTQLADELKHKFARHLFDLFRVYLKAGVSDVRNSCQVNIARTSDNLKLLQDQASLLVDAEERARTNLMQFEHERDQLVLPKQIAQLRKLGIHSLDNEDTERQFRASPRAVKYIMVYDPSIAEDSTPEWKWHLGCLQDLAFNSTQDGGFFACSIDRAASFDIPLPKSGEKASIYEQENGHFVRIFCPNPSSADLVVEGNEFELITEHDCVDMESSNVGVSINNPFQQNQYPASNLDSQVWQTDNETVKPKPPKPHVRHNMAAKKDLNILLLGETGVGKSTFINAYYNYLKFGSLDHALGHELQGLITSTFSYADSNFNIRSIKIAKNSEVTAEDGVDAEKNEVFVPGQSMTQHAKAYTFERNGQLVRIIDTPGIGDSRGVKMDQENFKQTIEYLKQLNHLNAICILLKPNIKRLELQTRYCIKELFSHLNKSSINNVVFCFTNTRSTSFRPGETLPSLRKFIEKEIEAVSQVKVPLTVANTLCFDNEAFRYLVLSKNLSDEEKLEYEEMAEQQIFATSWQKSSAASEQLIEYAQQLPVLNMAEVVSYNQTRTMSIDLVEKVIKALIKLGQQVELNPENTDLFQRALKRMNDIVERAASITGYLSSRAVTIFNDHLDAHLEEKIAALKSSVIEDQSSLARRFQSLRSLYQNSVRSYQSHPQIIQSLDVDGITKELYNLLEASTPRQYPAPILPGATRVARSPRRF